MLAPICHTSVAKLAIGGQRIKSSSRRRAKNNANLRKRKVGFCAISLLEEEALGKKVENVEGIEKSSRGTRQRMSLLLQQQGVNSIQAEKKKKSCKK